MSSSLGTYRAAVAELITAAGLPAFGYLPEQLALPAALVMPDDPAVTEAGTTGCGTFRARFRVPIIAGKGTNAAALDQLESHVETVLGVLDQNTDAERLTVSGPAELELSTGTFLGVVLTFETLITIGDTP